MDRANRPSTCRTNAGSGWICFLGLLLVLTLLPPSAAPAAAQSLGPKLQSETAKARKTLRKVGVHVVEVGSGRTVYSYRADELFILASNTKILTTAAALDQLGPGWFFETRFLARGGVHEGVLYGDLGVVGGADPTISGRDFLGDPFGVFRQWAAVLKRQGVERVEGDLFLDHGYFPPPLRHPDWDPAKNLNWYQVPIAALGFYENAMQIRTRPAERTGGRAQIELIPPVPFYEVENRVETTSSWREHRLGVRHDMQGGGELEVWGGIFRRAPYLDAYVAVGDPVGYFGAAMKEAFAQEGIEITGRIRPAERLPGLIWTPLATYRSDLLSIVEVTNRESQNFFAESLIRVLGAERCRLGTWEQGVRVVELFLAEAGLTRGSYHVADGSGLARTNRFSPAQMTTVLRHMAGHRYFAELYGSLPYGGQAGTTMEDRLDESRYGERVHAKTGTLTGVTTLSGYARGRSGRLYAFSVLVNDPAVWLGRRLQDAVAEAIVDLG